MGLDEGFDPFPDAGTFRLGAPSSPARSTAAERPAASARTADEKAAREAEREAARQASMELPGDIAAVLAGALQLADAGPADGLRRCSRASAG